MFKNFIISLKYLFKRKHKIYFNKNRHSFSEISNDIIKFFSFDNDIKVITLNNKHIYKLKNVYVNDDSDYIYILIDKYIYSFIIIKEFISLSYCKNKNNDINIYDTYDIASKDVLNNKQFFETKDLLFKFLEEKFKKKMRESKIKMFNN